MERLTMYNLVNFLMQSTEKGHSVMVETTRDSLVIGVVKFIDTQGPFPSVFIQHPSEQNGIGVCLHHIVTFRMAPDEDQPKSDLDKILEKG